MQKRGLASSPRPRARLELRGYTVWAAVDEKTPARFPPALNLDPFRVSSITRGKYVLSFILIQNRQYVTALHESRPF